MIGPRRTLLGAALASGGCALRGPAPEAAPPIPSADVPAEVDGFVVAGGASVSCELRPTRNPHDFVVYSELRNDSDRTMVVAHGCRFSLMPRPGIVLLGAWVEDFPADSHRAPCDALSVAPGERAELTGVVCIAGGTVGDARASGTPVRCAWFEDDPHQVYLSAPIQWDDGDP